ncbi:unnamed protein product, partial [Arabidopsis halleri]
MGNGSSYHCFFFRHQILTFRSFSGPFCHPYHISRPKSIFQTLFAHI